MQPTFQPNIRNKPYCAFNHFTLGLKSPAAKTPPMYEKLVALSLPWEVVPIKVVYFNFDDFPGGRHLDRGTDNF
jgi:hypothetical protein